MIPRKLIFLIFFKLVFAQSVWKIPAQVSVSPLVSPFQKCWELPEETVTQVASDNANQIFLPIKNGKIKAIDKRGKESWESDLGGEFIFLRMYRDRDLLAATLIKDVKASVVTGQPALSRFSLTSINPETGLTKWRYEFEAEEPVEFILDDRNPFLLISQNNTNQTSELKAVSVSDGKFLWEKVLDFKTGTFHFSFDNRVFVSSDSHLIFLVSLRGVNPEPFRTDAREISAAGANDSFVLFGDSKGNLFLVDRQSKETKVKLRLGGAVSGVVPYKQNFIVSSVDNFIYFLSPDGKNLVWKRRLPGRITEKPKILGEAVVTYSTGDNFIRFLDIEDGKIFNQIALSDGEIITGGVVLFEDLVVAVTAGSVHAFSPKGCSLK